MFITFEGNEGSGKTTCIKSVAKTLQDAGYDVVLTREPGGVEIAEQIRRIILDTNNTKMDRKTEALLYAAARRQHIVEVILPALAANKIILCDRFLDSSLAYQGFARDLGFEGVYEINKFAIDGTMPELTIYFDIDPEVGLQRINKSSIREVNRLDLEANSFHNRVKEGYEHLLERFPDRIKRIDASLSPEAVANQALLLIMEKIKSDNI